MKKFRIFSAIIAFACALCMAFALTGCGEDDKTPDAVEKYTVTFNSNGGSSVSSLTDVEKGSKINKPTDPTKENNTFGGWYKDNGLTDDWDFSTDTVNSDITLHAKWTPQQQTTDNTKVTESEWQTIFDSFTVTNGKLSAYSKYGDDDMTSLYELESATKAHIKYTSEHTKSYEETILAEEGEDFYMYTRGGATQTYTRTKMNETQFTQTMSRMASPLLMCGPQLKVMIKDKYSQFTYDDAQKAYVGEVSVDMGSSGIMSLAFTIKFEDGKVVTMTSKSGESTSVYSDFGATTVSVPNEYKEVVVNAFEVNADEWNELFDGLTPVNFTFEIEQEEGGGKLRVDREDENRLYAIVEHGLTELIDNSNEEFQEVYLIAEGGTYSQYVRFNINDEFVKTTLEEDEFIEKVDYINSLCADVERLQLVDNFEEFTFDPDENMYKGTVGMQMDVDFYQPFDVQITIENKALILLEAVGKEGAQGMQFYMNIGTATVTLPMSS